MGLFDQPRTQQPVWFMRQAGRYHWHYQQFRQKHDFMTLCKDAELASEITMGPIEDFDFNAAIMFSDLLFPLEQLSMGLNYLSGPPKLGYYLEDRENFKKLKVKEKSETFYKFQADTLISLKQRLSKDVTLLGFVGAPFTLYTYATEGGHKGSLVSSKKGLYDGLFEKFLNLLEPILLENIAVQLNAGADAICLFDTAVGELSFHDYQKFIIPVMKRIAETVKSQFPDKKIIYYSKLTHLYYLEALESKDIDVLGIDWRCDIKLALKTLGKNYYIQGNFDPVWLHLSSEDLKKNLEIYLENLKDAENKEKWIAGLGHGVLVQTPEENVRMAVKMIQKSLT